MSDITPEYCQKQHTNIHDRLDTIIEKIADAREDIARMDTRINGQVDKMKDYMDTGRWWRTTVVAVTVGMVGAIITGAVHFGQLEQKVEEAWEHSQTYKTK